MVSAEGRAFVRIGRPLRAGGMFLLTADLERVGAGTYRAG